MRWRPKNFIDSMIPVLTTFAIIGHGFFHYPPGRRHPKFSLIYMITATSLYYVSMAFAMKYFCDSHLYDYTSERFVAIVYANVAIAILAQILSWYYLDMLINFLIRIGKIDKTLQELGATFDYTRSMNFEIGVISLWIVVTCILNALEISWLVAAVPLGTISIVINIIFLPLHINSMVAYNFSTVISIVGMRIRKANELLDNIVDPIRFPVNDRAWTNLGGKTTVIPFTISPRPIFRENAYKKYLICIIKHVHLELGAISKIADRAYGVQVALEITACFIVTIILLFDIYRTALDSSLPRRYLRITVQSIWCITYLAKVVAINKVSEAISAEAHRTGDILHRIEKPDGDTELSEEIYQFSLQIMQNPLFFRPAGLITLGWEFLRGFIGTVTTYLVIFIQNNDLLG